MGRSAKRPGEGIFSERKYFADTGKWEAEIHCGRTKHTVFVKHLYKVCYTDIPMR